ncbi:prepilin-type N-terminal cleavage/methylation domain-containing protein [Deinococcus sp.]|uniref:PulJ/GspJ family protein n=1 Tax=Deinococcus sp. TaxID=47478 RepID=UPI0025DE8969|nr:prepilin-type N-terminal cleavage/methylation domain-containing protein [Deinococcus sp.]
MERQQGLTLVELLISLLIVGLLLTFITQLFRGTLVATNTVNFRNDLISEIQLSQQVISGRLTDAVYVYKPGDGKLNLTASGETTKNLVGVANRNSQNWQINTDPFVAMILPPQIPLAACTAASPDGCFRFFAYYAYPRKTLVDAAVIDPSVEAPNADLDNNDKWIIMEYRRNLVDLSGTFWTPGVSVAGAATYYQGGSGRILADYIQPDGAAGLRFVVTPPTAAGITPRVLGSVQINVTGQLNRTGVDKTNADGSANPGAVTTITSQSVSVFPRNWVCAASARPC